MHSKETSKILSGLSKKYLVTGAAGFIASQVCSQLLDQGDQVVGVDNLNDYYDVRLKDWRLQQLQNHPNCQSFYFEKLDIENQESLNVLFKNHGSFDAVLNEIDSRISMLTSAVIEPSSSVAVSGIVCIPP